MGFRKATTLSSWRKISLHTWSSPGDPSVYGTLELDMSRAQRYIEQLRTESGVKVTITHLVGIRRSLVERFPWLPVNVFQAFEEAKRLCMIDIAKIGHLYTTLPWAVDELARTRALMGDDFWPYGADANAHVIERMTHYAADQGLTARRLDVADLFPASVLALAKV